MALVKCKECGAEISNKAKNCPKCGAPNKSKSSLGGCLIMLILGVIALGIIGSFLDPQSTTTENSRKAQSPTETESPNSEEAASAGINLRVMVYNDTQNQPIPTKSEIWFRGHGSWWLQNDLKFGPAAKVLGERAVGELDHLFLYPDGRDNKEIKIPISMTEDMNPKGSDRDSLTIEISDSEIKISGFPLEAATGQNSKIVNRR